LGKLFTSELKKIEIDTFYLRKVYPVILTEFRHEIDLLSEDWSGTISIFIDGKMGNTNWNVKKFHHQIWN
jgi:hypothetical protein